MQHMVNVTITHYSDLASMYEWCSARWPMSHGTVWRAGETVLNYTTGSCIKTWYFACEQDACEFRITWT